MLPINFLCVCVSDIFLVPRAIVGVSLVTLPSIPRFAHDIIEVNNKPSEGQGCSTVHSYLYIPNNYKLHSHLTNDYYLFIPANIFTNKEDSRYFRWSRDELIVCVSPNQFKFYLFIISFESLLYS